MRSICAFANADGGLLVVGRNDRGEVVGVRDAAKLLVDIPNKVRDLLGIMVDANLSVVDGKEIIEIAVEPYPYPVSYRGEYHYRSGSTKQELRGAALDRFLLRKQGRHWDGVPMPHVAMVELSQVALDAFSSNGLASQRMAPAASGDSGGGLLDCLHLLEGAHLKRAAVLLFHPDPERYVTGAYVKMGYFESDADIRYQDEVHGDLFAQTTRTVELLLTRYLRPAITYAGLRRVQTSPVPDAALREAVLNALVHKDYASGFPVQISVYTDKAMIWNPGRLPDGWTVERLLQKHASCPHNPDIANAFFRAGLIEAWGRGIERMREACAQAEMPEPEFGADPSGIWLTLRFSTPYMVAGSGRSTHARHDDQEDDQENDQENGQETGSGLVRLRILRLLRAEPTMTRRELAERLGAGAGSIRHHIARLRSEGMIRHTGPNKRGRWEVLSDV